MLDKSVVYRCYAAHPQLLVKKKVNLFAMSKDALVIDRRNEARVMYEKLQSHPNARVSKKARQFMFSFQVTTSVTS